MYLNVKVRTIPVEANHLMISYILFLAVMGNISYKLLTKHCNLAIRIIRYLQLRAKQMQDGNLRKLICDFLLCFFDL